VSFSFIFINRFPHITSYYITITDYPSFVCSFVGAITITLAYGLEIQENNDANLEIAEKAMVGLMAAVAPGAFLVDSIPLLKYVPSWMPGAGFKRKAEEWNSWAKNMMEIPFMAAQSAIVSCRNCAMKLNTGISHPI